MESAHESPARSLRVLLVSHYALPHIGGIETLVHQLASELARRGHEVTHLASSVIRDGEPQPSSFDTPYSVVRVAAINPLESRLGVPYPVFRPGLARVVLREARRNDVIHTHGFLYAGTRAAIRVARRASVPIVLTEHTRSAPVVQQLLRRPGYVPYGSRLVEAGDSVAAAMLGRWALRRADRVVIFNESVREMIARLAPSVPTEWIETGVDTEFFRPPTAGERESIRAKLGWDQRPRVLFVGRGTAKKGFWLAREALEAGRGAFGLVVAGHVPSEADPDMEALGVLPRHRLAEIYRGADALVVPSESEGLPVALLEALASGLPVVATRNPGYAPVLADAGDALVLVRPTPDAVADAARTLVTSSARAPNAQAAEFVRSRLSVGSWVDSHERLYRAVIERGLP